MLSHFSALAVAALSFRTVLAQAPAQPKDVKTISSPGGIQVRYKEPTSCENTPGVKSYAGYIGLNDDTHYYFLFYESRHSPKDDPLTMWLTGGPGSYSLIAVYIENGPCTVLTDDLKPNYKAYSWNDVSNVLYLSQPMGFGFSYSTEGPGTIDDFGQYQPASVNGTDGEYPIFNPTAIDTTEEAAAAAWHVIQAFLTNLPSLDSDVDSKSFNPWTESYGGHYGPAFYDYFDTQNQAIKTDQAKGIKLSFDSLGVGDGLIDYAVQASYMLQYAVNNTYGLVAYNETVYNYGQFSLNNPNGCLANIAYCRMTNGTSFVDQTICAQATFLCRETIEDLFYTFSGLDMYDIRYNSSANIPSLGPLSSFLNQAEI